MIFLVIPFFMLCTFISVIRRILKFKSRKVQQAWNIDPSKKIVAFFHPYCNSGGGGERVLWKAISSIHERHEDVVCVIYSGESAADEEIIMKAEKRFDIKISKKVFFVRLRLRPLLEAKFYPRFTMIGQSLGSVAVAIEAAIKFLPHIYFESTGFAFTMPVFKLLGAERVGCYVHYPTISTDMLNKVLEQSDSYNNEESISNSKIKSKLKLTYYKIFAKFYKFNGFFANSIMVNSTWTYNHIISLWDRKIHTHIVYPPCNTKEFEKMPIDFKGRKNNIVSIGQFRPEKDHELQIRSFKKLKERLSDVGGCNPTLLLIGSCRNVEDERRVKNLKNLCSKLDIYDSVVFKLNVSFNELLKHFRMAKIGIHTMWNEHFGIGVVECMSAGMIMVAHDSGGPKLDIVFQDDKSTGYLAQDEASYCEAMYEILTMKEDKATEIIKNAREHVRKFSDESFKASFLNAFDILLS